MSTRAWWVVLVMAASALAPPAANAQVRAEHGHDPRVRGHVASLRFDVDAARRTRGAFAVGRGRREGNLRGQAGGPVSAASLGLPAECPGWFSGEAQHTLVLANEAPSLRLQVSSRQPTTLVVVMPDGTVWCDTGAAPALGAWFSAGAYRVMVGSVSPGRPQRYTLRLDRQDVAVGPPPPSAGIDPRTVPGTYNGTHPHWSDAVLIAADGTFRRGSGDPGRWWIEGRTLVLAWTNWDPERLDLQRDGTFRAPSNGFTLVRRSGVVVTPPPPRSPPSCRQTLLEMGHSSGALMFCSDDLDAYCADALLRAGHAPSALMFCRGVETQCAVQMLRSGRAPSELIHCGR